MLDTIRRLLVFWRNWGHQHRLIKAVGDQQWAKQLFLLDIPIDNVEGRSNGAVYFRRLDLELTRHPTAIKILHEYRNLVALVEKCGAKLVWDHANNELVVGIDDEKYSVHLGEEVYILFEIYVRGDYNLKLSQNSLLFDIGANVGFTALFLTSKNPDLSVIAYEPLEENYLRAKHNFELNSHLSNNINLYNFGLSNSNAKVEIQSVTNNPGRSSIVIDRSIDPVDTIKRHQVKVQNAGATLDQVIQQNPDKSIWVKMDCEGSEYNIIESLIQSGTIHKIKGFILEWHTINTGGGDQHQLSQTLHDHGYNIHMRSEFDISAVDGMCLAIR